MKKIAVYIGKFQPLHIAHEENIRYCLEKYDQLIVLVGSVNRRQSIKYPFSYSQVRSTIQAVDSSIIVKPLKDYMYNEQKWITQVEETIYNEFHGEDINVTIVGYEKDDSSYYLKEFPNFYLETLSCKYNNLSATDIRNMIFTDANIKEFVSDFTYTMIEDFKKTEEFKALIEEYDFYDKEKKIFASYPFQDTLKFMCSDAVVVCDGNVLLVKRAIAPGAGCWALPGGFVNQKETFQTAAIRELYEETCIKIPEKVMKGSLRSSRIFDHPNRNIGIPRISNAFYFEVFPDTVQNGAPKLPKVKGADDATEARWFSLAEVKHMNLFDDHSDIINYFTHSF